MNEMAFDVVQALINNAKRLGLLWTLTPGTVAPAAGASSLVPVIVDGDDIAINTVSLIGAQSSGMRVMVLTVPPAGNYIIGAYGGSNIRQALIYANTFQVSGDTALTLVNQTLTGATHSLTLTSPATLFASSSIDFFCSVAGAVTCTGGVYIDSTAMYESNVTLRVVNDRIPAASSGATTLDAGTYTISLRARRNIAAGTQSAIGTSSQMTIQIFQ